VSGAVTVAPGLHRWTAWHCEWEEDVASVAVETADGLVVIDSIDPPPQFERPGHVLITVFWHDRSSADVDTARVWATKRSARPLRNRGLEVTDAVEEGARLPSGIRAFQTARHSEVVYWLPAQKAVVAGDVLLGAGAKPLATSDLLRLCPERWLGKASHADLRTSLRPLLELPVQRVLTSHGEPVFRGGRRALEDVLA
jgi:glyoxylase-like metal-dependent hydrolase (beta-lactamase superfamily II)